MHFTTDSATATSISATFAPRLLAWQRQHGRHELPWQQSRDPYRIWLSEIMLQQTQVSTVLPYYQRFLARFPDVASLAAAELDAVLGLWSGLGYYARARNLHRCAQAVMQQHGGRFPMAAATLAALPGIGRSTAAAIAAFAVSERRAILDGNVKRVLCRHFAIEGFPGSKAVENSLWALAESLLPDSGAMPAYTQAMMDLGATCCTRRKPACERCPLRESCQALAQGRQQELPTARPGRVLREKTARFWLLLAAGRVYLEKRPLHGIWGGLLVPPEGETLPPAFAGNGLSASLARPLSPFSHTFTHFRLQLQPQLLQLESLPLGVGEGDAVWLPLDQLADAALPTPIRKLLQALADELT